MNLNDIKIRETTSEDFDDIMDVERQAFGSENEATLVSRLLADKSAEPIVSLLAFHKGQAIGHIFFTRVYFNDGKEQPMMHILAPVAVKPEYQRQGLGGMLIRTGIRLLQEMGSNSFSVLGIKSIIPDTGFYLGQHVWVIPHLILFRINMQIFGWFGLLVKKDLISAGGRYDVPMSLTVLNIGERNNLPNSRKI
ncbi:MAG: GNAT family N-acetyltransferase [Barnesiella sp.]